MYVLVCFFKNFSEALGKFIRRTVHLVLTHSFFWLKRMEFAESGLQTLSLSESPVQSCFQHATKTPSVLQPSLQLKSTSNSTVLTCYHVSRYISPGTLMSGFTITPVTQAGRLVKIKVNPEAISHLCAGEIEQVWIFQVNRSQISVFAWLCLQCIFLNCHSKLKAINNLKAYTDEEEGEGVNFRYSDWSLPSTLHKLRQRKRVTADRTCSQSLLPTSCRCSHNLSGEHPPLVLRPFAPSHKTQTWQQGMPQNDKKNQRQTEPPKDRPVSYKKTQLTPRQHFQKHLTMHLEILTLCPSRPPPAPAQWLSPNHPPRGWEPVSPPALGKSPAKFAHHTPQPRCTPLTLPWREGRQPTSPCSAVRLRAGRRVMESRELFSDNQRWEAAPVNSVHPVAAGSVSSSWQQPSQEQWWAQLEIFHN